MVRCARNWSNSVGTKRRENGSHRAITINSHSHTSTGDRLRGFCSGACLTSGRLLLKEGGRRKAGRKEKAEKVVVVGGGGGGGGGGGE